MALTEERLKEIEAEVGSQPYSVVLGLILEIRCLRVELEYTRNDFEFLSTGWLECEGIKADGIEPTIAGVTRLVRERDELNVAVNAASKLLQFIKDKAKANGEDPIAWKCPYMAALDNAVGAVGNTQKTMGSSEKTK